MIDYSPNRDICWDICLHRMLRSSFWLPPDALTNLPNLTAFHAHLLHWDTCILYVHWWCKLFCSLINEGNISWVLFFSIWPPQQIRSPSLKFSWCVPYHAHHLIKVPTESIKNWLLQGNKCYDRSLCLVYRSLRSLIVF